MKLICCGCGLEVDSTKAKTLDGRLVKNRGNLVSPRVSAELAPIWLKVASSRPDVDAVCVACAKKIEGEVGTIKVKGGSLGGIIGVAPLAEFPTPKEKTIDGPQSESFVFKPDSAYPPAVQIAEAIKEGRRLKFVRFDRRKDTLTPCIVSINVPDACNRREDWRTMRTLQSPKDTRAHFAFCNTCREIVEKCLSLEFRVTLFEAITGKNPGAGSVAEPEPFLTNVVSIDVARKKRSGAYKCNQCPALVNLLFDPATHRPVVVKEGEPVIGVCGACNKRISSEEKRPMREREQADRRVRDAARRMDTKGPSGGGDNRKRGGKKK